MKIYTLLTLSLLAALPASAITLEPIKYGDMNSWVTRHIKESGVIGGKSKTVYAIGPNTTINTGKAYHNMGGSPWATSNVLAKVSGVTKTSNAVSPAVRSGSNRCAKLETKYEHVKVLGLINMDVMVAGSMFLGQMLEPISSTKSPYKKMIMGIPYTKRPNYLVFDYKVDCPNVNTRVKSSGFGSKKTLQGRDKAVVFVFLQRRWEDAQGKIHAKRVGTGGETYSRTTPWKNGHQLKIHYGNASAQPGYAPFLALRNGSNAYYTKNSKGKMVPVIEEGWDDPKATPTHAVVMFSAGSGEPYVGTEGLTLYVDNVKFGF